MLSLPLAITMVIAAPVLPVTVKAKDEARLRSACAEVLALDEARLRELIPSQSGIFFTDCPACEAGKQEDQLAWKLSEPEVARCRYCGHVYPSPDYPATEVEVHTTPGGGQARYPYWADGKGYRHYFAATLDERKSAFFQLQAEKLAQLHHLTGDRQAARSAAVICDRFAELYPNYCYHYDYPFRPKQIFDGEVPPDHPRKQRVARWSWWAYMDIPVSLIRAYDLVRGSGVLSELSAERGVDVAERIEQRFFRVATERTLAIPDDLSNMSPVTWAYAVMCGRVIGEPRYVHEPLARLRRLLAEQFYCDGLWCEGTPAYHGQVLGYLDLLRQVTGGYSDPADYQPPAGERRFADLSLADDMPEYARVVAALEKMRLPDGRLVPVHDVWSTNRRTAPKQSESYLLGGVGHACLGRGAGDLQQQAHLTWSGRYGHQHLDGLALILFALGRELHSDLGYTHTAWRSWTLCSLAHNLVVIDGRPQEWAARGGDGTLRWFEPGDGFVQAVSADNPEAYPNLAETYRRTVLQVPIDEQRAYLVDRFDVAGGGLHDYLLWGSADEAQTLTLSPEATEPVASLLPEGVTFQLPKTESGFAILTDAGSQYGFLANLRRVLPTGALTATFTGAGAGSRVTLLTSTGDTVYQMSGPSIRDAGEDDAKLGTRPRAGVLWRREQATSRFVTVIEPFADQPSATVQPLTVPGCEAALRVTLPGGRTDVILLGAADAVGEVDGQRFTASGEAAVLSLVAGQLSRAWVKGPGRLVCGPTVIEAVAPQRWPLAAYEPEALLVTGAVRSRPGQVVVVEHGDGCVSPYTVESVEPAGAGRTRLSLVERSGYHLSPDGLAVAETHPKRDHLGPHQVRYDSFTTIN